MRDPGRWMVVSSRMRTQSLSLLVRESMIERTLRARSRRNLRQLNRLAPRRVKSWVQNASEEPVRGRLVLSSITLPFDAASPLSRASLHGRSAPCRFFVRLFPPLRTGRSTGDSIRPDQEPRFGLCTACRCPGGRSQEVRPPPPTMPPGPPEAGPGSRRGRPCGRARNRCTSRP